MDIIYEKSKLYAEFKKSGDDEEKIKEVFNEEFEKQDLTKKEIYDFLIDYKNIDYNKNKLSKYINLVRFFGYDVNENFAEYIFKKYILNYSIAEMEEISYAVKNNSLFEKIIKKEYDEFDRFSFWTSETLKLFSLMMEITDLNLKNNSHINDNDIKNMVHMQKLNLNNNTMITDDGIINMVNMTNLVLKKNNNITDNGIKNMVNMTYFDIDQNACYVEHAYLDIGQNACYVEHVYLDRDEKRAWSKYEYIMLVNHIKKLKRRDKYRLSTQPLVQCKEIIISDYIHNLRDIGYSYLHVIFSKSDDEIFKLDSDDDQYSPATK